MFNVVLFIIVWLLVVCDCYATPSITSLSGTLSSAQTLTITGSGFGTKSPAPPILWDDFEEGVNGNLLPTHANWTGMGGDGGEFSNANPYSGSLSAYNRVTGENVPNDIIEPDLDSHFNTSMHVFLSRSTDTIYYSYMFYYNASGSNNSGTSKAGRVNTYVDPFIYNGDGNMMITAMNPQSGGNCYFDIEGGTGTFQDWVSGDHINNTWHRHEMYRVLSTAGVADGKLWFSVIANDTSILDTGTKNNVITRAAGKTFQSNVAILGLMMSGNVNADADVRFYVDDVYIDNTRARVEIGNNATFTSCTHREIQIPVTWADGSVTVTVNRGTFGTSESAYLFVVDADGTASSGYAITFGSTYGGDATPPVVSISTSDPSNITADSLAISGTASDAGGVYSCKWRIGTAPDNNYGTLLTGTTSWSGTATGFSGGSNTLYVGCSDISNNWGTDSMTVNYTIPNVGCVMTGSPGGLR